nr:N-acetylmuramoyl-L-alanine amidase [uncultured Blautia sp.]
MKKFLCLSLAGLIFLGFPAAVFAASAPSSESEQGQAMIGPPASGNTGETASDQILPAPVQPPAPSDDKEAGPSDATGENSSGVDWNAANSAASPASGSNRFTVVIDPGHQGASVDMSAPEPVAPGSSQTKAKATSGTRGNFSNVPEYEVNLQISLLLRDELEKRGYQVVMTRTDHETAISNRERAELATEVQADITVRIHANSDGDSSASGALTMSPTSENPYLSSDIIEKSNTLASCILSHYCAATGLGNRGILSSDNMTGTNWSTVPVAILEMGFMSNQGDDLYITDSSHHAAMVFGIADGIDEYFSIVEPQSTAKGEHLSDLTQQLKTTYTDPLEKAGESWTIAVMDPVTDNYSTIRADQSVESAGLIKLFIMGTVFENLVYRESSELSSASYESELKPLLTKMIADNDNFSADTLIELLGNESFEQGVQAVNQFCKAHSFSCTSMGTERLEENSTVSNFTSASDCCRILTEIYKGTLVNKNAASEMLSLLKLQTSKDKIPSGLPDGTVTANMAGYMTEDQNPVIVENDAAIVLDTQKPYVVCILSGYLKDNKKAKETIGKISTDVYAYMTK